MTRLKGQLGGRPMRARRVSTLFSTLSSTWVPTVRSAQGGRATALTAALSPLTVGFVSLLASLLFVILPAPVARADDTSVGGEAGNLQPLASTTVRLEAETVQAILYRRFAEFKVDFLFVNMGEPEQLQLGFPYYLLGADDNGTPPLAFRAWQDGRPLPVRLGRGRYEGEEVGYFLHDATFPPGKTMITVYYLSEPTWSSGDRFPYTAPSELKRGGFSFLAGRYDYWLHTGAGWAGTIGKAAVRFCLADDFDSFGLQVKAESPLVEGGWPWTTKPETYTNPDPRTFLWEFADFEPTRDDNIVLALTAPFPAEPEPQLIPATLGAMLFPDTSSSGLREDENFPLWALADGSASSAWKCTPTAGPAWARLRIGGSQEIRELRILPGLNQTLSSFAEYGRPKTIRVDLSDGTTATFGLEDEASVQVFPLVAAAEWIRIQVLDCYPGSKSDDVFISWLGLGTQPAPQFVPFTQLLPGESGPTTETTMLESTTLPPSSGSTGGSVPSAAPGTSSEKTGLDWSLWSVVSFAVAGAAFLVLVALVVVAARRR